MKFLKNIYGHHKRFLPAVLSIVFMCALCLDGFAQEPPPRPVVVTVTQNLGFGAFTQGGLGGTIAINTSSVRSATGDVILLNLGYTFSAASYKLVANAGTVISILNGSDVILPGSNGGSMTLHIGVSAPLSPFVINTIPPGFTMMNVGGTLTVGNPGSNPPGNYSGIFEITFIQE